MPCYGLWWGPKPLWWQEAPSTWSTSGMWLAATLAVIGGRYAKTTCEWVVSQRGWARQLTTAMEDAVVVMGW